MCPTLSSCHVGQAVLSTHAVPASGSEDNICMPCQVPVPLQLSAAHRYGQLTPCPYSQLTLSLR